MVRWIDVLYWSHNVNLFTALMVRSLSQFYSLFFFGVAGTSHLYQCRWATPPQTEQACSQLSWDRCPPGTTPTGSTHTDSTPLDFSGNSLICWKKGVSPSPGGLCESVHAHPAGYDHGEGLDEALDGHQFVEPEHLAGAHIQTSLWHHTWGRAQELGPSLFCSSKTRCCVKLEL